MSHFRTVSHDEARALLADPKTMVLDVRTPGEHAGLGHVPGAWLIPVDLVVSAAAVLPDDGRPVIVYCEHGVRSVAASRLLAEAGVEGVLNLAGGLAAWTGPRQFGAALRGPSAWLIDNADLLPQGGRVLDVACGRGRHALLLASAGFDVCALDGNPDAVAFVRTIAGRLNLTLDCQVVDLETNPPPELAEATCDAVCVFNYLHRPLMPSIRAALKPGGRLFYETFTARQAERGHPKNPAFLLEAGELAALVAPLAVIRSREGEIDGRFIASVVAERRR